MLRRHQLAWTNDRNAFADDAALILPKDHRPQSDYLALEMGLYGMVTLW